MESRVGSKKPNHCIVADCPNNTHDKFCDFHLPMFHDGKFTEDGKRTDKFKGELNRGTVFCSIEVECFRRPVKRGFCERHYKWYRQNICDLKGKLLKKPPVRYTEDHQCKVRHCKTKPTRLGFCSPHYQQYNQTKKYLRDGRENPNYFVTKHEYNKDWRCLACGIQGVKFVKGLCHNDYALYQKGRIDHNGRPTVRFKGKRHIYAKDHKCLDCRRVRAEGEKWVWRNGYCPRDYYRRRDQARRANI